MDLTIETDSFALSKHFKSFTSSLVVPTIKRYGNLLNIYWSSFLCDIFKKTTYFDSLLKELDACTYKYKIDEDFFDLTIELVEGNSFNFTFTFTKKGFPNVSLTLSIENLSAKLTFELK